MDVHRAARISAAAHGGQTVISQQTRDLLEDAPVRDLGTHRLKDVGEARLFQLGEGDFPPLRSLALTNLHGSPDLVGRSGDADAMIDLLIPGSRLVTVTGAGGIGKTSRTSGRGRLGRVPGGRPARGHRPLRHANMAA